MKRDNFFCDTIKQFDTGEIASLKTTGQFTFCGFTLLWKDNSIGISQDDYRPAFEALKKGDFVGKEAIYKTPEKFFVKERNF